MTRFLFCLLMASALMLKNSPAAPIQPHIVFILADDLGWTQIGRRSDVSNLQNEYASEYYLTPQINRLAEMGMTFTCAYASPNCAPTRAALHSGMAASQHGITAVFNRGGMGTPEVKLPDNPVELEASFQTLAETLKSAGYTTGHFGKWHIGLYNGTNALQKQGFDINVGGAGNEHSSLTDDRFYHANALGQWRNGDNDNPAKTSEILPKIIGNPVNPAAEPKWTRTPDEHMSDALTAEAHNWMAGQVAANPDTPVFVYLAHHATHSPIDTLASDEAAIPATSTDPRHTRQAFGGLLYGMDRSVGDLLDYLENNNDDEGNPLIDNTIFIFMSDNGGEDISLSGRMAPLRGAKGSHFEGGVRVPLFISTPAMRAAGQADTATEQVVHVQDFHATLAALAGAAAPAGLDGVDFSQVLTNPDDTFSRDIFEWWLQQRTDVGEAAATLRRGDIKLIWYPFEAYNAELTARFDLFDIASDLSESNDLSGDPAYATTLAEMAADIGDKLEADGAPLPYNALTLEEVPLPNTFYAYDDTAKVGHSSSVVIDVLANDWDPDNGIDATTVQVVSAAGEGSTSVDPATGKITYTHNAASLNADSFTYTFQTAGSETSNVATVTLSVQVGWDGNGGTDNDLGVSANWSPDTAPASSVEFLVDNNSGFTGTGGWQMVLGSQQEYGSIEFTAAGTGDNAGLLGIRAGSSFGRFKMYGDMIFSGEAITSDITLRGTTTRNIGWAGMQNSTYSIINNTAAAVSFGAANGFNFSAWNGSAAVLQFGGAGDFIIGPTTAFDNTAGTNPSRLNRLYTDPDFSGTVTIQDGTTVYLDNDIRSRAGTIKIEGSDTVADGVALAFNSDNGGISELDISGLTDAVSFLASYSGVGTHRLTVDGSTDLIATDLRIPVGNPAIDIRGWVEGQSSLVLTDLGGTFYGGTVAEGEEIIDLTINGASAYMTAVSNGWAVTAGAQEWTITSSESLAGDDQVADGTAVILDGGTLSLAGYSDIVGTLTLDSTSVIDLSSGGSIAFAASTNEGWSGTLSISGTLQSQSLRFGTDAAGLTYSQLRCISIGGNAVRLDSNGYIQQMTTTTNTLSGDQSNESVFIVGGGSLTGSGTVSNLTAYALATVDPAAGSIGTVSVAGNYEQEVSSTLIVDADNGPVASNDTIAAGGTVDFFGTIDFSVTGDALQEGDEFTVITGGITMPTYQDVPAYVVLNPEDASLLASNLMLKAIYYTNKVTVAVVNTNDTDGILRNGDFDQGMFFFDTIGPRNGVVSSFSVDDADPVVGKNSLRVDITTAGTTSWSDLQIFQNFNVVSGETYTVSFKAKADSAKQLSWGVSNTKTVRDFTAPEMNDFANYGKNIGTSWTTFSQSFTPDGTDSAMLYVSMGRTAAGTIWIDDVKVTGGPDTTADGFKVVGYVPAYRYDNIPRSYYASVDALYYSFIMSDENGDVLEYYQTQGGGTQWYYTQAIEDVLQEIKSTYGLELLVVVGGGHAVDGFDVMLGSESARTNLIANLITFCNDHGFDGVDLDYEYPDSGTNEQEDYEIFVREAKAAFAGAKTGGGDLVLSAAVDTYYQVYYPPETYYRHDRNHVMGYRKDVDLFVNDIFELFNAGAPMKSIYPGVIFSAESVGTGTKIAYSSLYDACDPPPLPHETYATTTDGTTYYFNGIDAVRQKIQIARQLGCGGIMIWEFSHDSSVPEASLIKNGLEDADADGMVDRWEERYDSINLRPQQDPDEDKITNLEESVADTDPTDAASFLAMTGIIASGSVLNVGWQGGKWAEQVLQERDITEPAGGWADLFTNSVPTELAESHTFTNSGNSRWYRLRVRRP